MGVDQSRNRLQQTLKELCQRWEKVHEDWDDRVARDFHDAFISPLKPKVKTTMDAMEEMSELLRKMKRDCA